MAGMASNRAVSATVLLSLLITGWCMAMASAVPVTNGRRLQQLLGSSSSDELTSQLKALTAGLEKLSGLVQSLLRTVPLPADLLDQLQRVATCFDEAQSQLHSDVLALLSLPASLLSQPENLLIVQNLLNELATKLREVLTLFQNPQPVGGCYATLEVNVLGAISDLTNKLKTATDGLPITMKPVTLIASLEKLGNAVGQVNPCDAGLQSLPSNRQSVLDILGELLAAIQ